MASCCGCNQTLNEETSKFKCPKCKEIFCEQCDIFIHDILNTCPGCELL